jgi:hypothetical protein
MQMPDFRMYGKKQIEQDFYVPVKLLNLRFKPSSWNPKHQLTYFYMIRDATLLRRRAIKEAVLARMSDVGSLASLKAHIAQIDIGDMEKVVKEPFGMN